MSAPTRFTSGVTNAASFQPLGAIGFPDPFFYAQFYDDFLPYTAAAYTVTASGGAVAADAVLPNGRITFTSAATAASLPQIQPISSSFIYTPGKKLAFLCRVRMANVTTQTFYGGLITAGNVLASTVVDGIYFIKLAGTTNIVVNVVNASTIVGTTTLTGLLTNNVDIDLGFVVTPTGSIKIYAGPNLEGVKRQNATPLGPNGGIQASAIASPGIPVVLLSPTIASGNGATAAAIASSVDFLLGAQER